MSISYIPLGFFVKLFTGLDDLAITIPLVSGMGFNKTRPRQLAFALGIFLAATVAVLFAIFFSSFIQQFKYFKEITATLLFVLATAIYFRLLEKYTKRKVEKSVERMKKAKMDGKLFQIFSISFIAFLISSSDDVIAYFPLFLAGTSNIYYASMGIFAAVIVEIIAAIYLAEKINKFKNKNEITSLILVILGILVLSGVI